MINQHTIENKLIPAGSFYSVRFNEYADHILRHAVESNVGNMTLVSDHTLLDETNTSGDNLLVSDGVYFLGRISDCNGNGYLFKDKEGKEFSLKYSDLSGILTLKGSLDEEIPGLFRKLKGRILKLEKKRILGQSQDIVFADIDGFCNDGEYVVAKLVDSDGDSFTLGIDVLKDSIKSREGFTFNYNRLAGILVPITQEDLVGYNIDSRFY
jgi:hypothetical protein